MIELNSSVPFVYLQFSFTNWMVVPAFLERKSPETLEEMKERQGRSDGFPVLQPTQGVDIASIGGDLIKAGYTLSKAFIQQRLDPKDPLLNRTYWCVTFVFHRVGSEMEAFLAMRGDATIAMIELEKLTKQALWRVRGFINPFYQDGKIVSGKRVVSLNFEARQPLFNRYGQPITAWPKDEKGNRMGEKPLPLSAEYQLRIKEGKVQLLRVGRGEE